MKRGSVHGLKMIILVLGTILVFLSLGVSFYMNCVGRSLWLDEALLMTSFLKRDLWHLTSEVLENDQSAPILYLYLVKIMTVCFGESEFVLRAVSYAAYVGVVIVSYCFLKKMLAVPYPILGCAFVAGLGILMKYASEFKQYMTEAFCILLLLYLYAKYVRGELRWRILVLCLTIGIWMGNPCCFLSGAILSIEFFESLWKKDHKRTLHVVISGCIVIFSFGLYYLYWLKPVIDEGFMTSYWAERKLPILFFTKENLRRTRNLLASFLVQFGVACAIIVCFLTLLCFVMAWREKRKENIAIFAMFLLAWLASSWGLFPLDCRIWLFAYPLLCITSYYSLSILFRTKKSWATVIGLLICAFMIGSAQGITTYTKEDNIYRPCEEINPSISYLEESVNSQEKVYVYNLARFAYEYKKGIGELSIGQGVNNVFLGTITVDPNNLEKIEEEIDYVSGQPRIYLLIQHVVKETDERIGALLTALRERGYLELIKNDYSTPLYYFCQDIDDSKTMCEYQLLRVENTDMGCKAHIRIHNTGAAYLGNGYDRLRLQSKDMMEAVSTEIPIIRPGACYDVDITFDWDDKEEISLQLWLEDQYWFDELGVSPLKLDRY